MDSDDPEGLLNQITRHFYMDNWLVSFPTTAEATPTANHLTDSLKKGGFPLTQWAASSQIIRFRLTNKTPNPSTWTWMLSRSREP
jgi:hypothetical protein